jgi:hypothetical protein
MIKWSEGPFNEAKAASGPFRWFAASGWRDSQGNEYDFVIEPTDSDQQWVLRLSREPGITAMELGRFHTVEGAKERAEAWQ